MKETIKNLLKIKSLITLSITAVFIVLALEEKLPMETTTMIISMIYTYYFTKKDNDNKEE